MLWKYLHCQTVIDESTATLCIVYQNDLPTTNMQNIY